MKNLFILSALVLFSCGCYAPYHEAVLVDLETSEVGIMVETNNDNGQVAVAPKDKGDQSDEEFYKERLVSARRVEIPYYWKQTGYQWFYADSSNGKWVPSVRLLVVDTQPETREWSKSSSKPIWVESNDSVGFSTGISITARIENKSDAIKFLSNYPPKNREEIKVPGGETFNKEETSLQQIMDEEVRTKIQEVFSYQAAAYNMDELRTKKREIMDEIKEVVVPYFKERGITITTIGQFGGFEYENPDIQRAIDEVFSAQQDEEVAIAEAKAAEQRKVALKLMGEGEAAKILEAKRGESEGIKLVADAKAYELEKLNENPQAYLLLKQLEVKESEIQKWGGEYPKFMMGTENSPMMMLNLDTIMQDK